MKYPIHPAVLVIRKEITRRELTYEEVSSLTGIKQGRLRNVLSGRVNLTVKDRDIICNGLGIYPGEIVMQRHDLEDNSGFIDIRNLPDALKDAMRTIADALNDHAPSPPSDEDKDVTET